jgi:hypothetical protein
MMGDVREVDDAGVTDLDAIVRSFEPMPDGSWTPPELGRAPAVGTTTTIKR